MKHVYVVVGDIGGVKELIAPMNLLKKEGIAVAWFCDAGPSAKAGDVLAREKILYDTRPWRAYVYAYDKPNAIVVGTSATAVEAQLAWTAFGAAQKIPVLWMEDLWGTGSRKNVQSVAPTEMLVIDELAAEIARRVRPRLKTRVVGKPTFEKLPDMLLHQAEIRSRVRAHLNLNEQDFLIVMSFPGDPPERAMIQLDAIIRQFAIIPNKNFYLAWRFHPKHPQKDMLYDLAVHSGLPYVDARNVDIEELNFAANLVVAHWGSNDPYKALFAGVPVITMLFPDDVATRIQAGYPDGVPPICIQNCAWGAIDASHTRDLLEVVRNSEERTRDYTRTMRAAPFRSLLLPGAAEHIAAAVKEYL